MTHKDCKKLLSDIKAIKEESQRQESQRNISQETQTRINEVILNTLEVLTEAVYELELSTEELNYFLSHKDEIAKMLLDYITQDSGDA